MKRFGSIHVLPFYALFFLLLTSCKNNDVVPPVWVNEYRELTIPLEGIEFLVEEKNWEASLYSFTQPVPLLITYTDSGIVLTQKNKNGVTQGPAKIYLSQGKNQYFYDVNLVNKPESEIQERDYRSPKTVNPDSSLAHQKIVFAIDDWRNIVRTDQTLDYFQEDEISIPPKAGIYRAQSSKPISAYYVQPGSCISIPLNVGRKNGGKVIEVKAGPLKDSYDNTVADGTVVSFIYSDHKYTYQMDAALRDGFATANIPLDGEKTYSLFAKVNETISDNIQLKP